MLTFEWKTDLLRPSHQISNPFGSSTAEETENEHDTFSYFFEICFQ